MMLEDLFVEATTDERYAGSQGTLDFGLNDSRGNFGANSRGALDRQVVRMARNRAGTPGVVQHRPPIAAACCVRKSP